MPSPFPGMNPYLEQSARWEDFHNTFLILTREVLTAQLAPRYFVAVEHHVYVREEDGELLSAGKPDVSLTPGRNGGHTGGAGAAALTAPATVLVPPGVDEVRSVYLEVRDRDGAEVVTTIELLSPSNKARGPDRDAYRAKVRRILASPANFVEIDLLRGGPRMPWGNLPPCDYYAVVSRAETRPDAEVWPVRLRDPLPRIPVPVRAGEPGAELDLQAALHRAYDSAGYHHYIYRGAPEPRLSPDDAAWAAQFVPPHRPPGGA